MIPTSFFGCSFCSTTECCDILVVLFVLIESLKDAYKIQLDKPSKINKMWMNMTRSMIFF